MAAETCHIAHMPSEVPPGLHRLLPHHRDDLKRSGLTDETIEGWGAYSIESDQRGVLSQLGFGHLEPPCLALPIIPPDETTPNRNNVMLKPDRPRRNGQGHQIKYEARKNSRNRIHAPLAIREKIADASKLLIITEGAKKAEKAAQEGLCALAVPGVWNWRDRVGDSSFPIGDFDLIPLDGRCVYICFDSDAATNDHVRKAERDLAAFLKKRGAGVRIKRLPPLAGGEKCGLDDFLLIHTPAEFYEVPDVEADGSREIATEWPIPQPINNELPPVEVLSEDLLPASFCRLVRDVTERMQVPMDYPAVVLVLCLAGVVSRRAVIQPKANDAGWLVVPNLWGGIIAPPGFMKSPVIQSTIRPLMQIQTDWRNQYEEARRNYTRAKEEYELRISAWKEQYKANSKAGRAAPDRPDDEPEEPKLRRLIVNDSTFEALHQTMSENPAGILVIRDELTGWWSTLDRAGREGERAFCLQAWNGDTGHTIDRIGRGTIHVEACCMSMLGGIQPGRLRCYLTNALEDGPSNDGLIQRFQLLVWPDTDSEWKYIDRPPDAASEEQVSRVFRQLVNLDSQTPRRFHFAPEAQELFIAWLAELEKKVRGGELHPALISHFSKYRRLMPALALLFELAERAASDGSSDEVSLENAKRAAAWCDYLESHARRIYSCVASPQLRAARELADKIKERKLGTDGFFSCRDVYLKGWSGLDTPEAVKHAADVLEDAGWIQDVSGKPGPLGGRPPIRYAVNPRIWE